jgi:CDP-diacylglycerol--glycerol-3-phosphate 3-phosphatidyltransferase
MANLITFIRLALVFVIGAIALYGEPKVQFLAPILIIINIIFDGIDGKIARSRGEVSVFGAVFDIAADRIIEITLWIILAELGMVSIWIAIIFVTRGFLVDSIRKPFADEGKLPFSIMHSTLGKTLVSGRTMRFIYGFLKLVTFSWLFFLIPAMELWPAFYLPHYWFINSLNDFLVYTTVAICIARGVPVILENVSK